MGVDELQVGMRFLAETDQGPVPVEITAVEDDHVVVDGNHMLAGQNLKFNVEVVAIAEATRRSWLWVTYSRAQSRAIRSTTVPLRWSWPQSRFMNAVWKSCCGGKGMAVAVH